MKVVDAINALQALPGDAELELYGDVCVAGEVVIPVGGFQEEEADDEADSAAVKKPTKKPAKKRTGR